MNQPDSPLHLARLSWIPLVLVAGMDRVGSGAQPPQPQPGWQREAVHWRMGRGTSIRAVHHPAEAPLRISGGDPAGVRPTVRRERVAAEAVARFAPAIESGAVTQATYALVIDSPPIDGFVPYIAVMTTDAALGTLELDAILSFGVQGNYVSADPLSDYGIGILDTGAGAHIMGNAVAERLGVFDAGLNTGAEIEVSGVTGSALVWVSQPLGLFIDGIDAINPATRVLDDSDMVGQWNVSTALAQPPLANAPEIPTAIGSPLAAYLATVVDTEMTHTLERDGQVYSTPDIQFLDTFDPSIPEHPNLVPLELRPLGSVSVQYVPCIDVGGVCPGGQYAPESPSILIGTGAQSLFFVGSVDLADGPYSALDRTRFMFDTGAQVTVIGRRVAARLGIDPAQPEFIVEILGINGESTFEPGFYLDSLRIPALGEWLEYRNVPVVLLEVASPEGGTLDGIIGMNLFLNVNFVLRGGGLLGQPDPSLEFEFGQPSVADCDFDNDGDVDLRDFAHLQVCYSGAGRAQSDPACDDTRLDYDSDVDAADVQLFQDCSSGPQILATPDCAP